MGKVEESVGGSLSVTYKSTIEKTKAITLLKASGQLAGGESEEPVHMNGILHLRYARGKGNLTLVLTGSSGEETFNITMRNAEIKSLDSKVMLTGYIYISPAGKAANATLPLPSEINAALEQQGITYLRIVSLNRTLIGNTLRLGFTVELDLKELAAKLSESMEPEKAKELQKLLTQRPQLESYRLDASFTLHSVESILDFSLNLESRAEGNMTAYIEYSGKLNSLLSQAQKTPLGIALPKGGKVPKELMIIAMLQKLLQNPASGKLIPVPPSNSKLELNINIKRDKLMLDVDYTSHRQAVPGIGDPSERAERTLTILSLGIGYYKQTLQNLAVFLPGLDKLIPETVKLEAASPNVKLSTETATVDELATISVKIARTQATAQKTATTRSTTSPPPQTTATKTTTPTAAPTTTGKTTGAGGASKYTLALAVSAATLVVAAVLLIMVLRRR
jgi:hypothetical protein